MLSSIIHLIYSFVTNIQFRSSISKLTFLMYWSFFYFVTKFHFVHQYWVLQFSNIHMLQKFNLFAHIKTCIFEYWSNLYFVKKVQFVHPNWSLHFSNIHLLQKFNLFTHIKTCIFNILIEFLFCLKSSICSPISKLAFLKYW